MQRRTRIWGGRPCIKPSLNITIAELTCFCSRYAHPGPETYRPRRFQLPAPHETPMPDKQLQSESLECPRLSESVATRHESVQSARQGELRSKRTQRRLDVRAGRAIHERL